MFEWLFCNHFQNMGILNFSIALFQEILLLKLNNFQLIAHRNQTTKWRHLWGPYWNLLLETVGNFPPIIWKFKLPYIVMNNVIDKPCSMQHIFWASVTHSFCAKICDWKFVSIELGFLGSGFWFYVWLLVAVTVCFLLPILHLYFNCNLWNDINESYLSCGWYF
jgi:hypothetical protein